MGNRLTPIVKGLLLINLGVFVIQTLFRFDAWGLMSLKYFESDAFAPWQILTYMFVHSPFNMMHIFGNMLGLFVFGPWIENVLGSKRFFTYYMLCGMGAGILNYSVVFVEMQQQKYALEEAIKSPDSEKLVQYFDTYESRTYLQNFDLINDVAERNDKEQLNELKTTMQTLYSHKVQENSSLGGASGAIFGIMMAFFLLFPNVELMLLFFPFPIKAKYIIGFYVLFELYSTMISTQQSNIAHLAHLGGALVGFLLIRFWKIRRQY
jgi:membrane associated rhomboid family serine protease